MKKKILSVLIIASISVSSSIFTFANQQPAENQNIQVVYKNDKQEDRGFFSNNYDLNKTITDRNRNGSFTAKYKYLRSFFDNTGNGNVTVFIQTSDGTTLDSFKVEAGKNGLSSIIEVNPNSKYKYVVNCDGGTANITGKLVIKTATDENELK